MGLSALFSAAVALTAPVSVPLLIKYGKEEKKEMKGK